MIAASRQKSAPAYSAVLLSSEHDIKQLGEFANRFPQCDPILEPAFFLASLHKGWKPRVVTVYEGSELIGVVYAKERVIKGIPTGVAYPDGSLAGPTVAATAHQQNVFRIAAETLLESPKIHGLRLRVRSRSCEVAGIRQLIASRSLDVGYSRIRCAADSHCLWKYDSHLNLPDTYEEFLKRLGSTTRHNFRYYRRRFEASGSSLVENISVRELRSAVIDLAGKSRFQGDQIERDVEMVAATRRPMIIGLKHRGGEWLSVLGGWYRPDAGVLLFQCNNDRDFGQDSLSVVLRSYLIECLIRQGLKELVIIGGTAPPLSRYAKSRPMIEVRLDKPTYAWRSARFLFLK